MTSFILDLVITIASFKLSKVGTWYWTLQKVLVFIVPQCTTSRKLDGRAQMMTGVSASFILRVLISLNKL